MTKNNKGDKKRVKSNDEREDPTMRETIQRRERRSNDDDDDDDPTEVQCTEDGRQPYLFIVYKDEL